MVSFCVNGRRISQICGGEFPFFFLEVIDFSARTANA